MRHSPTQDFGFATKSEKDKVAFAGSTMLGKTTQNMLNFTSALPNATLAAGLPIGAINLSSYIPGLLPGASADDQVTFLLGSCEIMGIRVYNTTTYQPLYEVIDRETGTGYMHLDFSGLKILSTDAASIVMTDATGDVFLTLPDHGLEPWYATRILVFGSGGSQAGLAGIGQRQVTATYVDANTIRCNNETVAGLLAHGVWAGGTVRLFSDTVMLKNHINANRTTMTINIQLAFDITNPLFLAGVYCNG